MSGYFRIVDGEKVELTAEEAAPYVAGTKRHRMLHGVKVVFTDAEEAERDAEEAAWLAGKPERDKAAHNAPILKELEENDRKSIRALIEGDTRRIAEHKAKQDALRAKLK